ncbi:MAG: coproporphyrinogen dehydrogenase HemZ, partial [Oscillospiraceae bacterium]
MTLIFSGNEYKYQLEAVMKLFIPAQLFDFIYNEKKRVDGDFAFIRKKALKNRTLLYVFVRIGDKIDHKAQFLDNAIADDNECEMVLSQLLFKVMCRLTGKKQKWGIMTGVRPVKRVNDMISQGSTKEQIYDVMQGRFFCSKEKTDIAYETAKVQSEILSKLDKKSFSLYISIPFCPTRCSYCSFVSQSVESCLKIIPEYVDKLCGEIIYTSEIVQKLGLKLDTVYFGGGTPTTLQADQIERIMKCISEHFDMSNVREYTVEAGRADTITPEKLEVIKANGANRISINPQTLSDSVLQAIGRKHSVQQFFDSFAIGRKAGFETINTDIIAGLPTDTLESFKNTVDKLIELAPENITVHTLSIKRAARLNSEEHDSVLKNPASEMVDYATKALQKSGYHPYYLYKQKNMLDNLENIGWSRSGHESLYNIYIMEEVQSIFAMGAGGSTKLIDLQSGRLERIFNYKTPLEYNKH